MHQGRAAGEPPFKIHEEVHIQEVSAQRSTCLVNTTRSVYLHPLRGITLVTNKSWRSFSRFCSFSGFKNFPDLIYYFGPSNAYCCNAFSAWWCVISPKLVCGFAKVCLVFKQISPPDHSLPPRRCVISPIAFGQRKRAPEGPN